MTTYFTEQTWFFGKNKPDELLAQFGSPLYVYNEAILRERCRELASLMDYPFFKASFSVKANSNLEILKIVKEEGLNADAMSPGEIHVLLTAGFKPEEILFTTNNVSAEEFKFAMDRGILASVDSISQLELFGKLFPGAKVAARFNPGHGAGHHEKVVTGGKKTKFGINADMIDEVKDVLKKYDLRLVGVNHHIGSLFMDDSTYLTAAGVLLDIAAQFDTVEFADFGGGFGIPYHKQEGQGRLDLKKLGEGLGRLVKEWAASKGRNIKFYVEPGRYPVAESAVLLGSVNAIKSNYGIAYVGTDIGFNVLARPMIYDSHHDIEIYRDGSIVKTMKHKQVTVTGNICETGDILAKDRSLPPVIEGDVIGIMDAGAYGFSMSSNYNNRLRPAEVMVRLDGSAGIIRRRDTLEDLMRNFT